MLLREWGVGSGTRHMETDHALKRIDNVENLNGNGDLVVFLAIGDERREQVLDFIRLKDAGRRFKV